MPVACIDTFVGNRHYHNEPHPSTGNIRVAFWLNLVFTVIEIIGGILTNSLAILSDALHDLGDSLSLGLAWYFQRLSSKSRDSRFSYGYRRFSLLGAIINSMILILGSAIILYEAVPRLIHPEEAHAPGMMALAVIGILVNGAAVLRLKRGSSLNERTVMLHLMEDVLGWTAVLIGSIVMYFTGLHIIDPILSIAISLFILFNVVRNLSRTTRIILQAVPANIGIDGIRTAIEEIDGVQSVHDLHIWSLDGEHNVLTVHIVIRRGSAQTPYGIKQLVNRKMAGMGIDHCTIETEAEGEECVLVDC